MAEGRRDPQPGDLIEIFRPLYQHWALYVGDGYVIHVTDEEASSIFLSSSSISATRAKVKMELLKDVVKNDNWRVNNKYDRSRTPRRVKEIIRDAEQWIGEEVSYDVLTNNCEHFVTELRYGEALCDQVEEAINGGVIAAALGIVASVAAFAARALLRR
ncbi:phospholipase A and acyltransferase 1 isoform X3 [Serinus canaria]|uniref:phospholipase A and acyltransferase 1 isoform X3 n=1 Tax=Serinus canaria TaxID=9135 RepID=UPI0021CCCA45|nr:phospholipase A and acyltransferase 1 isoform X3 [Serinus canaria]